MKVKVFSSPTPQTLEDEVNAWLEKEKPAEIVDKLFNVTKGDSPKAGEYFQTTLIIWYKN